jgi:hypothetical protein
MWMVDQVVKALPVVPTDKPLEKWTHGEILADGARHGLLRLREVAMRPVEGDAWEQKLVLQASESLTKLYAHVQVEQLRHAAEQEDWRRIRRSWSARLGRWVCWGQARERSGCGRSGRKRILRKAGSNTNLRARSPRTLRLVAGLAS